MSHDHTEENEFPESRMSRAGAVLVNQYWFLDKAVIGKFLGFFFGIYVLGGTATLSLTGEVPVLMSLGITLGVGIFLCATVLNAVPERIKAYSQKQGTEARNEIFLASLDENDDPSSPDGPGGGSSDEDAETIQRKKRVEFLKHNTRKTRDDFLKTSFNVVVSSAAFAVIMSSVYGLPPVESFMVSLPLLAVIWLMNIFMLPKFFVYFAVLAAIGLRVAVESFGMERIMMLLPNFIMLPFFYFFMMIFMFGSILYPTIRNMKFLLPGEADLAVRFKDVRGQPGPMATVMTQMKRLQDYASGNKLQKPSRGMVFEGKPGVGKTYLAKALAYEMGLPFIQCDGTSLNSGIGGMAPLIISYLRKRVENLAAPKEKGGWGGAIVFIDEGETIFGQRSGMQNNVATSSISNLWDMFNYDDMGVMSQCGQMYDTAGARERFWDLKNHNDPGEEITKHKIFFPMGGMGGGGAIYSLLTWLDGVNLPPWAKRFKVNKINKLLSLLLPVEFRGKILRLKPAKPIDYNIVFITATNRPHMIDSAMRRPGRLGVAVMFDLPDLDARKDVAEAYALKEIAKGLMNPNVLERLQDFANVTAGTSPAEIQQIMEDAHDHRVALVNQLKRIKENLDAGIAIDGMGENDVKLWRRWEKYVGSEGWDDLRADWHAVMEARSAVAFGKANPSATSEEHRKVTARHEFRGHFIELFAFVSKWMKPIILTIMPRRNALGMVAHVPLNDRVPRPQEFYEGLLRVSIGSTVAERYYQGSNQPGVGSDLENATRICCFMIGKCAMRPYKCSEEDWDRYKNIGKDLISIPEDGGNPYMGSDPGKAFMGSVLRQKDSSEKVAVFLGMAFVDVYRLIRANAGKFNDVDGENGELLRIDEYSGVELEKLWARFETELITFDKMSDEDKTAWPDKLVALESPIYAKQTPEYEEVRR